jgi:hypothetical protein
MKAWLSIDFEDIAFDFKREFGIPQDGTLREGALNRAYDAIESFLQAHAGGARLTFFTTGILAAKAPAVVARIAADGHEIACHYHYHDPARDDPPETFDANLRRAIAALEAASGQKILGFRAPRFSLKPRDRAHFEILATHFAYDSSVTVETRAEAEAFLAQSATDGLARFPVVRQKVLPGLPPLRTGGAYLKYFPASVTLKGLALAEAMGVAPMLYLHPYEFRADRAFYFPIREMGDLALRRKLFLWARQTHCHVIGNRGVPAKLRAILAQIELGGPMRDLLSSA